MQPLREKTTVGFPAAPTAASVFLHNRSGDCVSCSFRTLFSLDLHHGFNDVPGTLIAVGLIFPFYSSRSYVSNEVPHKSLSHLDLIVDSLHHFTRNIITFDQVEQQAERHTTYVVSAHCTMAKLAKRRRTLFTSILYRTEDGCTL